MKIQTIVICMCCSVLAACLACNDNSTNLEQVPMKAGQRNDTGQWNYTVPAGSSDSIRDIHPYPGHNSKDVYPVLPTATGSDLYR